MALAYLFNWYPLPSQTALRREVTALEDLGVTLHRFSLRRYDGELVDQNDRSQRERTRAVMDAGVPALVGAVLRAMATRPRVFLQALVMAIRVGLVDERGLFRNLVYFAESCLLLKWLAELRVTHLHTHYATNSATVAMLCRIMGGPSYSFTVHGPEEFDASRANCLREKIHHAAFVVAISEFTRSQLYRWADYRDWSKIHVVYVGVSPLFLERGPVPVPSAPRLVNIGRIVEQKGQAILIQAAAELRNRGSEFEIVIVGDGPMRGAIEELIDQLGLRDRVRITGYLSNQRVLEELVAARALVLPSFAEGLPGVFFESLALGRPVISTYIAAHPELIEPGVNGWLVPAGAIDPLADVMAEALTTDPAELERMGRAGAARVAERHNSRTQAGELFKLFQGRGLMPDQLLPASMSANRVDHPRARASAPRSAIASVGGRKCKVLVIIVNYRTAALAIDCLSSLAAEISSLPQLEVQVVVTDNASGDDSVPCLEAAIRNRGWGDWASIQPLDRNGGFACGNNAAIQPALGSSNPPDYVWLLNPDTLVRPRALAALVEFMNARPDVGIAGSRLEEVDGTPQRSAFPFPGVLGELEGGVRLNLLTQLLVLKQWSAVSPISDEARSTDWVGGASMLIRREVFETIGLLDEAYFMYFEEVDFCRRARDAGWRCWYVPSSHVVHLIGRSSGMSVPNVMPRRRPAYWFEARRRYFLKNCGKLPTALADAAFLSGFACWRLRRRLQRKPDYDPPHLLGDSFRHSVFCLGFELKDVESPLREMPAEGIPKREQGELGLPACITKC
jgi:colanic acid/amylovoran biosynthesis glycosyltransferase